MKMEHMRKALNDFVHPYFLQYAEEFLAGEYLKAPHTNASELIGSFAVYCESCGYWEV